MLNPEQLHGYQFKKRFVCLGLFHSLHQCIGFRISLSKVAGSLSCNYVVSVNAMSARRAMQIIDALLSA